MSVKPFSVLMRNADHGWDQYGVYDTIETATTASVDCAAQYDCATRVVTTASLLNMPAEPLSEPLKVNNEDGVPDGEIVGMTSALKRHEHCCEETQPFHYRIKVENKQLKS